MSTRLRNGSKLEGWGCVWRLEGAIPVGITDFCAEVPTSFGILAWADARDSHRACELGLFGVSTPHPAGVAPERGPPKLPHRPGQSPQPRLDSGTRSLGTRYRSMNLQGVGGLPSGGHGVEWDGRGEGIGLDGPVSPPKVGSPTRWRGKNLGEVGGNG